MKATADGRPDDATRALNRERFMMHLIAVVDAARTARLEAAMAGIGLTIPKHRTLDWLVAASAATMVEVARGTFIDRTTLSRSMDQMVADGLVQRRAAPGDRRKVIVELTADGARMAAEGARIIDEVNARISGAMETEAVRVINSGLLTLLERLVPNQDIRDRLTGRSGAAADASAKQT